MRHERQWLVMAWCAVVVGLLYVLSQAFPQVVLHREGECTLRYNLLSGQTHMVHRNGSGLMLSAEERAANTARYSREAVDQARKAASSAPFDVDAFLALPDEQTRLPSAR
jgi:hypothetical protein